MPALIHLYATDLDCFPHGLQLLPAADEQRVLQKGTETLRRRQRASLAFVRHVLAEHLSKPPEDIAIRRDPGGKPYTSGIHFNLSHSGARALLAVSTIPLGIDIEKRIEERRFGVSRRVLSPTELGEWLLLPDAAAQASALTRAWVRKEAVLKALGSGLRVAPSRVDVGWAGQGGGGVIRAKQRTAGIYGAVAESDTHQFTVQDLPGDEGFMASIAYDEQHAGATLVAVQRRP